MHHGTTERFLKSTERFPESAKRFSETVRRYFETTEKYWVKRNTWNQASQQRSPSCPRSAPSRHTPHSNCSSSYLSLSLGVTLKQQGRIPADTPSLSFPSLGGHQNCHHFFFGFLSSSEESRPLPSPPSDTMSSHVLPWEIIL